MSERRLSPRRLEIIKRIGPQRYRVEPETLVRLVAEIEALRAERDSLAHSILNVDDEDEWRPGFALAQKVLGCRLCPSCGEEVDWTDCVYCSPYYDETLRDVLARLAAPPCGVCDGARGRYESCTNAKCSSLQALSTNGLR
jgi:hypothetical protein